MVNFNEFILSHVTHLGSDLQVCLFCVSYSNEYSSISLLYKWYSLFSLYSVKHQIQCHLCVGALQILIGDDQDNDGDKWSHETDESFSGRGGCSSYVMFLHQTGNVSCFRAIQNILPLGA